MQGGTEIYLCRLREALRQRGVRNIWASDPESGVDEEEEEGDDEVDADEEEDDDMLDMVRQNLTGVLTAQPLCKNMMLGALSLVIRCFSCHLECHPPGGESCVTGGKT